MFARFGGFRTVRIALEDLAPGGAVAGKPPGGVVEKKTDALAVVVQTVPSPSSLTVRTDCGIPAR
jgi:hypothetical protein